MRLIDLHCDTIWMLMREKNTNLKNNPFCVDVEKMKAASSMAQFFACFIYLNEIASEERWEQGYQLSLDMIKRGKAEFTACSKNIALALSYEDMVTNYAKGKLSAFLTVEEGGILNSDLNRLQTLYDEGIRLITLTWNHENCIGYPNSKDKAIMQKGLKPFGVEVVEKMNELGMIIDVSHLSDGGFWDVLKYSKKPIVASHSNVRSLCNHPRNLSDEMIKALAEQGGIAGVNLYPYFINKSGKATVKDIADHVWHMYQTGGEDFIAVGTDFDGFDEGELEIAHIGEMDNLYEAVKRRGLTQRQMEKFWTGNAVRVMKQIF
ncbi:MAG: dipeptidase [Faecalimonas sp.]|nr:dipeptidase [Faecalimonas sp.]